MDDSRDNCLFLCEWSCLCHSVSLKISEPLAMPKVLITKGKKGEDGDGGADERDGYSDGGGGCHGGGSGSGGGGGG